MADNYLQFSTQFECDEPVKNWLIEKLEDASKSDEGSICSYENETDGVWLYAEEYGDIERLVSLIEECQRTFDLLNEWVLTWAETCSKPRLDEFSGGAVAVYRGESCYICPSAECRRWLNTQKEKIRTEKLPS